MASFSLRVNKQERRVDAAPDTPLLWVLRDQLGLTGTKYGCGIAECGVCTVHLDGQPELSCTVSVSHAAEHEITTIEGLSEEIDHPVQRAWIAGEVPQCGYCQSGQIMMAAALLAENPSPSDEQIDKAMSTVLCRCGTYRRIRKAVLRAAGEAER